MPLFASFLSPPASPPPPRLPFTPHAYAMPPYYAIVASPRYIRHILSLRHTPHTKYGHESPLGVARLTVGSLPPYRHMSVTLQARFTPSHALAIIVFATPLGIRVVVAYAQPRRHVVAVASATSLLLAVAVCPFRVMCRRHAVSLHHASCRHYVIVAVQLTSAACH